MTAIIDSIAALIERLRTVRDDNGAAAATFLERVDAKRSAHLATVTEAPVTELRDMYSRKLDLAATRADGQEMVGLKELLAGLHTGSGARARMVGCTVGSATGDLFVFFFDASDERYLGGIYSKAR